MINEINSISELTLERNQSISDYVIIENEGNVEFNITFAKTKFKEYLLSEQRNNKDLFEILNEFRSKAVVLLGTTKLNCEVFLNIFRTLTHLIQRTEDFITFSLNIDESKNDNDSILMNVDIISEQLATAYKKFYELIKKFFEYDTNNIFLDSFLNFYIKYLKKICKLESNNNLKLPQLLSLCYSDYSFEILKTLINKKIIWADNFNDSKIYVKIVKAIMYTIKSIKQEEYILELNLKEIYSFLILAKTDIYHYTKDYYLEKMNKIVYKTVKYLIINFNNSNNDNKKETLKKFILDILTKILDISKLKDKQKLESFSDEHHYFYLNNLTLFIKIIIFTFKLNLKNSFKGKKIEKEGKVELNEQSKEIFNPQTESLNLKTYNFLNQEDIKEKIFKILIELSFWDNSSIVDKACSLIEIIYRLASGSNVMISNFKTCFEKIFDFMFLRRYKLYFNYLNKNHEGEINQRLAVLEVITNHLNSLISKTDFLVSAYFHFDFTKIRFNMISEIFTYNNEYYKLQGDRFKYLKTLINLTYLITFNKIHEFLNVNFQVTDVVDTKDTSNISSKDILSISDFSNVNLKVNEVLSKKWLNLIETINLGKIKTLKQNLNGIFNLNNENKSSDAINITNERIASSLSYLLFFSSLIDVNTLSEIIGSKDETACLIMKHYCKNFDFSESDILKSYKTFVATFILTGENLTINNIIAKFSDKYFEDLKDKNYFNSPDEVLVLSYSLLMLNTDLHNKELKEKMTCDEFITSNLRTGYFKNIPVEYFKNLYKNILNFPLNKASLRNNDYSKGEELFENIKNRINRSNEIKKSFNLNKSNIVNFIFNLKKEQEEGKVIDKQEEDTLTEEFILNYPIFNYIEDFNLHLNLDLNQLKYVYFNLWNDLFDKILKINPDFYEASDDEKSIKILEKVCQISQIFNQKDNIDKIIVK